MQDKDFVPFTREMKKDYTILVPNMLPIHFRLIISVLATFGYHMELLENTGAPVVEAGLKYTHNDACYPAVLVVGQFMDAMTSGKYDPDHTALIMFQTGGGCRASNYISLIRKALKRAGMPQVPVISMSLAGVEHHPGFQMMPKVLHCLLYAVTCGDLLMSLVNQVKPYERERGAAERLARDWTEKLSDLLGHTQRVSYRKIRAAYDEIIRDFAAIPREARDTVRVGVVGEIFVKYSPLANNDLEDFLVREGAEVMQPGLLDFCLYCVINNILDADNYGRHKAAKPIVQFAADFLNRKRQDVSDAIAKEGTFRPWTRFETVPGLTEGYIHTAVKMGEGWLLTAEMLELIEAGCGNIVCTQPFGCLPNHICGKGMMKPIKEKNPDVNILALDYDPGASRVNQENRLKLMLSNARR